MFSMKSTFYFTLELACPLHQILHVLLEVMPRFFYDVIGMCTTMWSQKHVTDMGSDCAAGGLPWRKSAERCSAGGCGQCHTSTQHSTTPTHTAAPSRSRSSSPSRPTAAPTTLRSSGLWVRANPISTVSLFTLLQVSSIERGHRLLLIEMPIR